MPHDKRVCRASSRYKKTIGKLDGNYHSLKVMKKALTKKKMAKLSRRRNRV